MCDRTAPVDELGNHILKVFLALPRAKNSFPIQERRKAAYAILNSLSSMTLFSPAHYLELSGNYTVPGSAALRLFDGPGAKPLRVSR